MVLFIILFGMVLCFQSNTPVEWRDCKPEEANSVTTFRRSMNFGDDPPTVDIQDVYVNHKEIDKSGTLTARVRGKLLEGTLEHPTVHVAIKREGMIIPINFPSLCNYISCPVQEGEYVDFELSHTIPRVISLVLDGEKTKFDVIAVVSESAEKVGCVKFDITVTQ